MKIKKYIKYTLVISLLVFLTGAYLPQPKIVFFNKVSDLPTVVDGEIPLECKYYIFTGNNNPTDNTPLYFTNTLLFPPNCDSGILGISILNAPLVYLGTGTFLKGANIKSIRLYGLTFAAPAGQLFDIAGNDRVNTFLRINDVITSNVANLGRLSTITALINDLNFIDFGQGLIGDTVRFTVNEGLAIASPKTATKNTPCTFENVGNTVEALAHEMFNKDMVRLTTDGTLPTGLRAGISDLNGAVIDNGDGTVRFTSTTAHGFTTGDTIFIPDTANYKGFHTILATPATTTFDIKYTYTAETLSNNTAQQVYFVVNKTADDFQLSKTENGAVIDFTTDGTGNHQFFENTIGLTLKGTLYSFTLNDPVFSGTPATFTAWDFEPTATGKLARGSIKAAAYDRTDARYHYAGGSNKQDYTYITTSGTRNGDDSRVSGVVYITGNALPFDLSGGGIINEITVGSPASYNLEGIVQSANRLCNADPSSRFVNAELVASIRRGDSNVKTVRPHILKNGLDATQSEPVVDVRNSNISITDSDTIRWDFGDCLSFGIESESGATTVIVSEYKLIIGD